MYAWGDKFGIPSLQSAAAVKFTNSLPQDAKSIYSEEAVELVFQSTVPGDCELRFRLPSWALDHRQQLRPRLGQIMAKHEPLSWKMHLKSVSVLDTQARDFQAKIEEMERESRAKRKVSQARGKKQKKRLNAGIEATLKSADRDHQDLSKSVGDFVQYYNETKFCSSCGHQIFRMKINHKTDDNDRTSAIYGACLKCGHQQRHGYTEHVEGGLMR